MPSRWRIAIRLRESNNDDVIRNLNDRFTILVVVFDMLIILISLHSYRAGSSVSAGDVDDVITRRHPARPRFRISVWADPD